MLILFHPAHRRFIRILRSYADRGVNYNFTEDDKRRYKQILERSTRAKDRHQSIYKLVLEIINRDTPLNEGSPFDHSVVDQIEKQFAKVERKNPWKTFRGIYCSLLLKKQKKMN